MSRNSTWRQNRELFSKSKPAAAFERAIPRSKCFIGECQTCIPAWRAVSVIGLDYGRSGFKKPVYKRKMQLKISWILCVTQCTFSFLLYANHWFKETLRKFYWRCCFCSGRKVTNSKMGSWKLVLLQIWRCLQKRLNFVELFLMRDKKSLYSVARLMIKPWQQAMNRYSHSQPLTNS